MTGPDLDADLDPFDSGGLFDVAALKTATPPAISVAQEFLVPPFSVLDTRQGYWQERKRKWATLGIRSEIGRSGADQDGKALTFGKGGGTDEVSMKLQAMTGGTSIFDPVLCELVYRWFSPVGGRVLDPFAGGSVRGVAASVLARHYTGLELRAEQVDANREQQDLGRGPRPVWITGDSAATLAGWRADDAEAFGKTTPNFDLVFTCPPYADLEVYSDDPADLSNMPYPQFLDMYGQILTGAADYLKADRFYCVVIGDVRDKKGFYRGLVDDTSAILKNAGLEKYNEAILVNAVGTAAMRAPRQFRATRKLGTVHQRVLVYVKGDPKKAAESCGTVDTRGHYPDAIAPADKDA